jgi:hypothetical protein
MATIMATVIHVRKLYDTLVPVDAAQLELLEQLQPNEEYKATFTKPRNSKFFRKWWALAKVAFDAWDAPNIEYKGVEVKKNFERFRKDLIVMSGFFDPVFNIKGELRLEPKSLRFDQMSEENFSELYNRTIDVVLGKILTNYTREDIDYQVNKILRFS